LADALAPIMPSAPSMQADAARLFSSCLVPKPDIESFLPLEIFRPPRSRPETCAFPFIVRGRRCLKRFISVFEKFACVQPPMRISGGIFLAVHVAARRRATPALHFKRLTMIESNVSATCGVVLHAFARHDPFRVRRQGNLSAGTGTRLRRLTIVAVSWAGISLGEQLCAFGRVRPMVRSLSPACHPALLGAGPLMRHTRFER
jgi:hypothetical protein